MHDILLFTCVCINTYIHIYMYCCSCVYVLMHIYVYVYNIYIYIYIILSTHARMPSHTQHDPASRAAIFFFVLQCVACVSIYTCIYMYIPSAAIM